MVDQILAAHGLTHIVVDRPAGLLTHWAAAGTGFATQYASCLVRFAAGNLAGTLDCRPHAATAASAGAEGPPSAVPPRSTSFLQENSTSVVDLKIGRRENISRTLGRR
jgi:hypothetical protein